jgi:hypothetical protein
MHIPDPNGPDGCGAQTSPAWQSTCDGARGETQARAFWPQVAAGTVVVAAGVQDPPVAVDAPADMLVDTIVEIGQCARTSIPVHWLGFRMMSLQCVVVLHVTAPLPPKNWRVGVEHVTPTAPHWQPQVALGATSVPLPE